MLVIVHKLCNFNTEIIILGLLLPYVTLYVRLSDSPIKLHNVLCPPLPHKSAKSLNSTPMTNISNPQCTIPLEFSSFANKLLVTCSCSDRISTTVDRGGGHGPSGPMVNTPVRTLLNRVCTLTASLSTALVSTDCSHELIYSSYSVYA